MTKRTFIWDFDGTLVESYQAIHEVLVLLYETYGLEFDQDWVMDFIIKESVGSLLRQLAAENNLDFQDLLAFFNREQEARDHMINIMPYALETLEWTKEKGIRNIIYTHKGDTTGQVLERLGIAPYFEEVITSANGFKRKPDPEAVDYLIEKYDLDPSETYYIGDRRIDVEVAQAAGILSINLGQVDSEINRKIEDLSEITSIFA
ncbi:HAD-IA family hydrolase [Streptococcus loxodontisalivarius]|uniref:HAD superfamily hydrolase (TIGR01549 family) n=1 Tax=Streptococcus loxodontisalivarius TaxID=1349415 RepID=A0ABS2PSL6_9STRE|nr:HAD-IA family hydrolase [Streptococcus loxodontisalivarius]MBM7643033.1 HAD superfamily hydrolase (TIGR01549 family) [Streptococcus loxodontisalivarius]